VGLVLVELAVGPVALPLAGIGWTLVALPVLVTAVTVARPGTGLAPDLQG
jgi:hypothetical protein